ncbi:MAG TPA: inorganic diphosphatase [Pseudomonadales bacterium]|nr:inorganic diphosphatase [Pseudomonadales bacterium]
MSLSNVPPGLDLPNEINVIIEIPANTGPIKYEVDKVSGAVFVDRFMATPMFYPCNYGYVPGTLADDGDPLDVLVITPFPVLSGAVIAARPVGVLKMEDEAGDDAKILAVPPTRLTTEYESMVSPETVQIQLLRRIEHFFAHYKDLEPGKWVRIDGWGDADDARRIILESVERHKAHQ